jgi:uncharacterized protein YeaC (DUF1315 family)
MIALSCSSRIVMRDNDLLKKVQLGVWPGKWPGSRLLESQMQACLQCMEARLALRVREFTEFLSVCILA